MVHDGHIQGDIALSLSHFDHAWDLVGFFFPDHVRDRRINHEDFEGGDPSRFVDSFEKVLRNDAFDGFRECSPNLVLLA